MLSNTEVIVTQIVINSTSQHHYHCQKPVNDQFTETEKFTTIHDLASETKAS